MSQPAPDIRTVTIERDIAWPPEKIWRALTQPHLIAEWLMQNDFVAQVGYRFDLRSDFVTVDCRVTEVDPPRSLAYTWDAMGLESAVTWTLIPTATGTHLRMDQAGFKPDQNHAYQGAKFGWKKFFDGLDQLLGRVD